MVYLFTVKLANKKVLLKISRAYGKNEPGFYLDGREWKVFGISFSLPPEERQGRSARPHRGSSFGKWNLKQKPECFPQLK